MNNAIPSNPDSIVPQIKLAENLQHEQRIAITTKYSRAQQEDAEIKWLLEARGD